MSVLEIEVRRALHQVFDPCSISARSPLSIIDMGLVTRVEVVDSLVAIAIRPTSRGCTMMPSIMQAAEDGVRAIPGVREVKVTIDHVSSWTQAEITPEGQHILDERRRRSKIEVPIEPMQWKTRAASALPKTR
jgi:metal-sulfur cluster biosynthetic enzyme